MTASKSMVSELIVASESRLSKNTRRICTFLFLSASIYSLLLLNTKNSWFRSLASAFTPSKLSLLMKDLTRSYFLIYSLVKDYLTHSKRNQNHITWANIEIWIYKFWMMWLQCCCYRRHTTTIYCLGVIKQFWQHLAGYETKLYSDFSIYRI